jgi:nitroreductase
MSTKIFTDRRSVNFFDPSKKVDKETFDKIIETAALAPSAFNLQPWRIIAVQSDEAKDKLMPLAFNQPKVKEASHTLILVGDRAGYESDNPTWEALAGMVGKEGADQAMGMAANLYGTSDERKVKFAESNAGLLAMSIMYAAQAFGVDSHAMSGVDFEGLKKEYGLKESEDVVMLITLGYFDSSKELYPRAFRKTGDDLVKVL